MQGLMMVALAGHAATLPPDSGKPILYIDFLESAPWNAMPFPDHPYYSGVGSRLFEAAIRLSKKEGFRGRVSLHALPQSEHFYRETCGMTELAPDPQKEGLRYFELTSHQADAFLAGEE
jgi:hypothetical protein